MQALHNPSLFSEPPGAGTVSPTGLIGVPNEQSLTQGLRAYVRSSGLTSFENPLGSGIAQNISELFLGTLFGRAVADSRSSIR